MNKFMKRSSGGMIGFSSWLRLRNLALVSPGLEMSEFIKRSKKGM